VQWVWFFVRMHNWAGRCVAAGRISARACRVAAAAAFAALVFHDTFVATLFDDRGFFARRHRCINFAAAGFIDLLVVGATVTIVDAFGANACAATGHAEDAAFAIVLSLRSFRDDRHKFADRSEATAAVRAASAAVAAANGPSKASSGEKQKRGRNFEFHVSPSGEADLC